MEWMTNKERRLREIEDGLAKLRGNLSAIEYRIEHNEKRVDEIEVSRTSTSLLVLNCSQEFLTLSKIKQTLNALLKKMGLVAVVRPSCIELEKADKPKEQRS